jgi:hypothetical protein
MHTDDAILEAELTVPAHLHGRLDRQPRKGITQHGMLVGRILLAED